jgi:LemA protein
MKMKGCLVAGVILVLILAVFGLAFMGMYNGLVAKDEECNKAWANVESVLQRRFDLIPNLVNTVKGYAAHEKGTLEEVTRLRSQWGEAKTQAEKVGVASMLEGAMGRLMVVMENYPELKADKNFLALQDELAGTENRISVERQRYNGAVQIFNTAVRQMPTALLARIAGFNPRAPFEAAPGAETAPTVQF